MSEFSSKANAISFVESLLQENYHACEQACSSAVKQELPEPLLKEIWEGTIEGCGHYVGIARTTTETKGDLEIVQVYMSFEQAGVVALLAYSEQKIQGLTFNPFNLEALDTNTDLLPEPIEEVTVTIGQNPYPLPGKLTRHKGSRSQNAVLLVHGSGPQDMDETILGNKPFRDLAWGLAKSGIDVLRYDKRTYTYADKISQSLVRQLTVYEETIEDAIFGTQFLIDMGYERIFLAGHSLGGMLAPRIQEESHDLFAGIIILAGSPRPLTDIILDQNNDAINAMPEEQQGAARTIVETEKRKLIAIDSMKDEQLALETVFGMPGNYVKDINAHDTGAIATKISVPFLILQGAEDFQVYPDRDFPLWKDALKHNHGSRFVLYPGLGHLFTPAPNTPTRTLSDYTPPARVSEEVTADIVEFITETAL